MAEKRKTSNCVPAGDCLKVHVIVDERLHKLDLALFGEDGCHGLVGNIGKMRTDVEIIKASTGLLRQIFVPILSSLITAGIMYVLLRGV